MPAHQRSQSQHRTTRQNDTPSAHQDTHIGTSACGLATGGLLRLTEWYVPSLSQGRLATVDPEVEASARERGGRRCIRVLRLFWFLLIGTWPMAKSWRSLGSWLAIEALHARRTPWICDSSRGGARIMSAACSRCTAST